MFLNLMLIYFLKDIKDVFLKIMYFLHKIHAKKAFMIKN